MKNLLRDARKSKGLRTRELAAIMGVDQSLISKFENMSRTPSVTQLRELSRILEISFDDLMKAYLKDKIFHEIKEYAFAPEVLNMVSEALASYHPERIIIDETIEPMLEEIDFMKMKLDNVRQFENHRITEALAMEYTFESNKIEGNTLTLQETALVVNEGITIGGKSMREHLEAINHTDAIEYMYELVQKSTVLNERELLRLHSLVLRGINPEYAGRYRDVQVMIQGSTHLPPAPYLVQEAMEDYFIWYRNNRKKLHPIVLAAEMHERLVTIHPFIDGNGRTSRLIMNLILLQNGFVIANIKGDSETKMKYYSALEKVQTNNLKDDFIRLVVETEKECLERYLSMMTGI